MASATCPKCGQAQEDSELFCAQCGSAVIPQYSRMELQDLQQQQQYFLAWPILIGSGLGVLIGSIVLAVLIVIASQGGDFVRGVDFSVVQTRLGWVDIGLPVMLAFLGGVCGLIVGIIRRNRKRKGL